MSFLQYKRIIEAGDLVVAYLTRESASVIRIESGAKLNNRYGEFLHDSMIGKEYGSKLASRTGRGFIHLLHPTPELWTTVLPHRTQILYLPDIAFISGLLDLKPGSRVVESGTGSGSFSHALARTVAPHGHLYTFEFHQARADQARKEFEEHGLNGITTLECRDVCKEGFNLEGKVDAIFLDLPAPWEAIASAKKALDPRKMGRICCFSPCIEQVQRTRQVLNQEGFTEIRMYESLSKSCDIKSVKATSVDEEIPVPLETEEMMKTLETEDGETTEDSSLLVTKFPAEVRGHTSYLTFATLVPTVDPPQ
ncbi:MAG: tRNA methyltransferase complex GCD14 subunit-domain-containing protein [Piptocephalis tieghemiana]|nr:MAG: tRNA methyltransferase complex GCD14 subunit-domain-containing protein [Piptocephalis tieghemiana]